jgi:hypothetical protein
MALFWVSVLAISILFYVVLDGFDLGSAYSSAYAQRIETARDVGRCRATVGWQRDLAHRRRRRALGGLSGRLCDAVLRILSPAPRHARGTNPARGGARIPVQDGEGCVGSGT